jgi:DNA-binding response OmpR family regulator
MAMTGQPLIVIADSNPALLAMISQELSKRGFEVVTVSDGQRALDTIRQQRPAAAVLEWVMPTLQGPRVCAKLKADEETAEIPIVLLTARAAEADIASGFGEGADDYLTKPFSIDELDEMLWRLISEKG